MKTKAVAMFVVGVCIMAWGCGVSTQQAEAQFRVLEEIYIAPGTAEEFEAASKARTARMVAGNVAFGRLVSVTNDGVYRFVTQLEEDFSSVGEWREQIAAMPASSTPGSLAGIIDHIDRSIWQASQTSATYQRVLDSRTTRSDSFTLFDSIQILARWKKSPKFFGK